MYRKQGGKSNKAFAAALTPPPPVLQCPQTYIGVIFLGVGIVKKPMGTDKNTSRSGKKSNVVRMKSRPKSFTAGQALTAISAHFDELLSDLDTASRAARHSVRKLRHYH